MGPTFQDFKQAQIDASQYALRERQFKRRTVWYVFAAVLSAALTALIFSPEWLIPNLIFSAITYAVARYAKPAYLKVKEWWSNRRAKQDALRDGISLEPLVNHKSKLAELRNIANDAIHGTMQHKSSRIQAYENFTTLRETTTPGYYDYKHIRALSQYHMLQITKNAALNGQGEFIGWFSEERQERRAKKLAMLTVLKEYVDGKRLSICLKHVKNSSEGKCQLAGDNTIQKDLLKKLKEENQKGDTPLVKLPTDPVQENDAILKTLLPLVVDMDNVLTNVQPIGTGRIISVAHSRAMVFEHTYPLTSEYLAARIEGLTKARHGALDSFKNHVSDQTPVNEDTEFVLKL